MSIKFSIITCTYNASDVLQPTLDSVLKQSYEHVEHIIVDGQSADSTVSMAQSYKAENDSRNNHHAVIVKSEPDHGLYDAMNKGIGLATGDYLVFLNAGDKLHDADTLSRIAACAEKSPLLPGVLYGDTDIVDMEGRFLRHRRLSPPDKLTWKSFKQGMLVCHQAFYARVDLAQKTPYNLNYRYSADVDWCIRIMKEAEAEGLPLLRVNAVLVDYLDGGMSIQNHKASLMERFAVMRRHYGLPTTIVMHLWFVIRGIFS